MEPKNPGGNIWRIYRMGGLTSAVSSVFDGQNAQHMAFIRSMLKEQRKKSLYEIPLNNLEVSVFDLETSGFSPYAGDEIISIGAVLVNGTDVLQNQSFYTTVKPKKPISKEIEALTNLTNESLMNAPDLIHSLSDFFQFVQNRVLVVHGSGHDKQFLNYALWKTSKANLSHRLLDTMMIAKWLHPRSTNYTLDELLEQYEIEITQRHHALEDSIMTAKLWSYFMQEMISRNIETLGDLYDHLSNQK